jgi:hypothetical protein
MCCIYSALLMGDANHYRSLLTPRTETTVVPALQRPGRENCELKTKNCELKEQKHDIFR